MNTILKRKLRGLKRGGGTGRALDDVDRTGPGWLFARRFDGLLVAYFNSMTWKNVIH